MKKTDYKYCHINPEEAKAQVQAVINERVAKFRKFLLSSPSLKYLEGKLKTPRIVWRSMGKNVAGNCWLQDHKIEMNTNYLTSKDWKHFISSVPLHELAHSIAYDLFQEKGHGPEWKAVDRFLGDNGERCHTMEFPTVNSVERIA